MLGAPASTTLGKREPASANASGRDGVGTSSLSSAAPLPVRRTMRLSLVEGSLVQVFLNWTSGSVLIGYLLSMGAAPTHIALVGSVPFLAQVVSPIGAWAAEVLGRRRGLSVLLSIVSRLIWLLTAFVPQMSLPAGAA